MPSGDRQWDSEWLPVELREAERAAPAKPPGGAAEPAQESSPAKPEPHASEDTPSDAGSGEIKRESGYSNGGPEVDGLLDRLSQRAERAKSALRATEDRGEEIDDRARHATADATFELVKAAEARAQDAAVTADRLATKVSELSERLAQREQELQQLHEAAAQAQQDEPEPQEPAASALDLNEVGFDQLCGLGLSVKQAARLIGYREQSGGFESPDDLDRLTGMPRETIEALKHAAGG